MFWSTINNFITLIWPFRRGAGAGTGTDPGAGTGTEAIILKHLLMCLSEQILIVLIIAQFSFIIQIAYFILYLLSLEYVIIILINMVLINNVICT